MTEHGSYCWLDSQVHASSCICRCWLRNGEVYLSLQLQLPLTMRMYMFVFYIVQLTFKSSCKDTFECSASPALNCIYIAWWSQEMTGAHPANRAQPLASSTQTTQAGVLGLSQPPVALPSPLMPPRWALPSSRGLVTVQALLSLCWQLKGRPAESTAAQEAA